jgi:hypothetical protein
MRRAPIVLVLLAVAACGGERAPGPRPAPTAVVTVDATLFGRPSRELRVPERDRTPPLALMRLDPGTGTPVVHDSPERKRPSAPVALPRPAFTATALARDTDGGTGRIRVSVVYFTHCGGRRQQYTRYFPPSQIERIRLAPGVLAPTQRTRTVKLALPSACPVSGVLYAEATNAHELESVSDPIRFTWK